MRYLAALGLVWASVVLIRASWLGSQGRLPYRSFMALRVPRLMTSESVWRIGHAAAAGPLGVAGGGVVLAGVAVAILGLDNPAGWVAFAMGVGGLLGGIGVGLVSAYRALPMIDTAET